ncbi:glucose-1-phosphate adenylyltransferase subunit GlgD [Enterococcus sp. BWR-S5]|uniref:glucose-1-phosphate adenylyltransferase subunit GlgD n=1 Tax=Enterococcus sp. BWR-S5 TaxID=2787714 RepID=UPI0019213F58|nr:glucose-1-phosphate adenylyltransferase subunit GlgD [Enterococcus sp. BWR-S5]MBL1226409.1 glucose-1-phosphate adenylyltransferase subunit GlgD [Enterococcus sp. BWR-S5]
MKTNRMCAIIGNVERFDDLMPLIEKRPLAMLPFDCKYRLIDFQLSSVVNANIGSLFMIFNDGETQSVFDHIGGGKEWNLDSLKNRFFTYFYQDFIKRKNEGKPYFSSVIDYLNKSESEYTVIMSSRMLCNLDLRAILKIHQARQNTMTMVYKRVKRESVCSKDTLLDVDENGQVSGCHTLEDYSSETESENLSMDAFIVQTNWLIQSLEKAQTQDVSPNLLDFLKSQLGNVKNSIYEYTGYLKNIYSLQSYYKANMDMLEPAKFNALMYTNQKIYTKLKNEVPTYYSEDSKVSSSQFATGCVIQGTVEHSLVSRRSRIDKGAVVKHSIINTSAKIASNAWIEYAILDKNVIVDPGVQIKGTPEKPVVIRKGEHVTTNVSEGEV